MTRNHPPRLIDRRSKIISKYVRGTSVTKISKELGISRATIYRDLRVLKKETLGKSSKEQIDDFLFLFKYTTDEILKELWMCYTIAWSKGNAANMVGALNSLIKTLEVRFEMMQKFGIIGRYESESDISKQLKSSIAAVLDYRKLKRKREEAKKEHQDRQETDIQ